MTPIESIYEIEVMCLDLREYLRSKDVSVAKKTRGKYEQLVDRFFRGNVNSIKPEQSYNYLHDYDYFLKLMESTRESFYSDDEYSS